MIKQMKLAGVWVSDTDRAYDFYVNKLGFDVKTDQPMGEGGRWLEVAPPGADTRLAVCKPFPGQTDARIGGFTGIHFAQMIFRQHTKTTARKVLTLSEKPARQVWATFWHSLPIPMAMFFS